MVGTTPAHQVDSTISNICARPAKRHFQAVVLVVGNVATKMTTPACVSGNDDALQQSAENVGRC
jgi:hypothetical protein